MSDGQAYTWSGPKMAFEEIGALTTANCITLPRTGLLARNSFRLLRDSSGTILRRRTRYETSVPRIKRCFAGFSQDLFEIPNHPEYMHSFRPELKFSTTPFLTIDLG